MHDFQVEGLQVPVLVARVAGKLFAGSSLCPHEDVFLSAGDLRDGVITCPGHGYRFDPASGQCAHDPDLRWKTYKLTVEGDDVYVDLL